MIVEGPDQLVHAATLLTRVEHEAEVAPDHLDLHLLDELLLALEDASNEGTLLAEVHPAHEAREAAETRVRSAEEMRGKLLLNGPLYAVLSRIEATVPDPLVARSLSLIRQEMRRTGVALRAADRQRAATVKDLITDLTQAFQRNIREDQTEVVFGAAELAGLPSDFTASHPARADGTVHLPATLPVFTPFMAYARDEQSRKRMLAAWQNRAVPDNLQVLADLIAARHELATLLGYPSWAAYATADTMTGSAPAAWQFLKDWHQAQHARLTQELAELLAMKQRDNPSTGGLGEWDLAYYRERVRAERLAFDAREVRPYFEYHATKSAMLDLVGDLFGLTFISTRWENAWHPSVETFEVSVDGEARGHISLDMHPRDGKFENMASTPLRTGIGNRQRPHYVLIGNFPDPSEQDGPVLLEHRQVVTLFHEFGHLVHGILMGTVPWVEFARGIEFDFMEVPSMLLEEWIYDATVLARLARHVETAAPMPEEMVERLRTARDFGMGTELQGHLFSAVIALGIHDRDPSAIVLDNLVAECARSYAPARRLPSTNFLASFGHLAGYSALFYTYAWSSAIAKDLLSAFTGGLTDPVQLRRYRDLVLARGASTPSAQLVAEFLGRPFSMDAYQAYLAG